MAEREHFTNFRCITFGTGLAIMTASFGAQVNGWQHWITVGIGYGVGIVLMLIATVLITKSYFSRQSEHLSDALLPPPSPPATPIVQPPTPSKLRIISSYYGGINGEADEEVTEKYLRRRVYGDALVGWVGADLFGPFQPVINLPKRLIVRYSFSGQEATVTRPENAMLVLPEDQFLKQQLESCQQRTLELEHVKGEAKPSLPNLFSPLQLEAFQLAKELRNFLIELGARPEAPTEEDYEGIRDAEDSDYLDGLEMKHKLWVNQLVYGYASRFSERAVKLLHRLGEQGVPVSAWQEKVKSITTEWDIKEIAKELPKFGIRLDYEPTERLYKL